MHEIQNGPVALLQFESLLKQEGVAHAFTLRPFNYAPHRGPDRERAAGHRQEVCKTLGMDFERLTSPSQVHGAEILPVEISDVGRGRDGRESAVPFVDGLICDRPGVGLVLMSADCPLVWAYDPDRPAVGAVHASWRGTVARASENLIIQMRQAFGSDPARLLTGIAPCAGPCCFEVGDEVRRIARGKLTEADECFAVHQGRMTFDLWKANSRQLIEAGVPQANIEVARMCTICDSRFWSYRRDGAETGRSALFIGLCG